jgi:hypothetical protein
MQLKLKLFTQKMLQKKFNAPKCSLWALVASGAS